MRGPLNDSRNSTNIFWAVVCLWTISTYDLSKIGEVGHSKIELNGIILKCRYLVGNPCTEFIGYRDYVIATLPQLQVLDSEQILRSDRILAIQNYSKIAEKIFEQEEMYKGKYRNGIWVWKRNHEISSKFCQ